MRNDKPQGAVLTREQVEALRPVAIQGRLGLLPGGHTQKLCDSHEALRTERDTVLLKLGRAEEALRCLLEEPYGCPFCDSGKLRRPQGTHDDDCGFAIARAYLAGAEESTKELARPTARVGNGTSPGGNTVPNGETAGSDCAVESRTPAASVLIWSMEHNSWRRPNWHGYTDHRHEAGRYPRTEAQEIVDGSDGVNERIVELTPDDDAAVQPCGACESGAFKQAKPASSWCDWCGWEPHSECLKCSGTQPPASGNGRGE